MGSQGGNGGWGKGSIGGNFGDGRNFADAEHLPVMPGMTDLPAQTDSGDNSLRLEKTDLIEYGIVGGIVLLCLLIAVLFRRRKYHI